MGHGIPMKVLVQQMINVSFRLHEGIVPQAWCTKYVCIRRWYKMFANALLSFIMYYCCNDRHVRDVGVKMVVQKFLNSCQSMVS